MNRTKINAIVIADSLNPYGDRITTMVVTMPRIILAEFNTHRMFSRNSASNREIPFGKMLENIKYNPFIPIAWQKEHKGTQGTEYITDINEIEELNFHWNNAVKSAIHQAKNLNALGITKQLANRLLEPFMWHTVLITASEWENFFNLRCPKYLYDYEDEPIYFRSKKDWVQYYNDSQGYTKNQKQFCIVENLSTLEWLEWDAGQAEIHMMALAECIYDAVNESTPKQLKAGEWHIPFYEDMEVPGIQKLLPNNQISIAEYSKYQEVCVKIATAMCARVSYTVVGEGGKESNYENDIKLHNRLLESGHWSSFEHCAKVPTEDEYISNYKGDINISNSFKNQGWFNNFHGFIPYRKLIENEK